MTKIELLKEFAKGWFGNSQQHSIQAQLLKQRGFGKLGDKIMAESDEEWNEARSVLSLTKEEEESIYYWDDLFRFDQECENAPKSGWRKRWRDLGGKDFWEVL